MPRQSLEEVEVAAIPKCNFCHFRDAEYDGKTKSGPWAYMCGVDFKEHGVGLGLGKGQRLVLRASNEKNASVAR